MIFLTAVTSISSQCPAYSEPGPYITSYRTISEIPTEDETITDSRVYYPSVNDTIPNDALPCPISVFAHGFMTGVDNYYTYAAHLASWGYVCIVPRYSNPFLFPNHNYRARLIITSARYIADLNFSAGDIFEGKLDVANWSLLGHSMGGSVSLLAGDRYVNYPDSIYHLADTLKAIVSMGSPQSDPETVPAHITTPYMILCGTEDGVAPWEDIREAFWVGSYAPGVFTVIDGANHSFFTDNTDYGWLSGDGTATITRDEQRAICRRHLTAFLERYARTDTSICNFLYTYGDSIVSASYMDSVETRYTPLGLNEDSPSRPMRTGIRAWPNPFNSSVTISVEQTFLSVHDNASHTGMFGLHIEIGIFDVNGRIVDNITVGETPRVPSALTTEKEGIHGSTPTRREYLWQPPAYLPSGVYLIRARFGESKLSERILFLK